MLVIPVLEEWLLLKKKEEMNFVWSMWSLCEYVEEKNRS